ncbi:MAG: GNAT family N-acetyltransferase [Butyrivibrio sp.]|nr:GNAT family N-acetyltransferase [Muribaculum sp.]MCM1551241.1 GNAT family N-acetyltransferase [Butyrivibrio sp.]
MKIRKMLIDDYDDVYALWMSCTGMGLNNLDDSQDGIDKFITRNPDTCFVAESEGKIIGVIMSGNDGRRGYIYHISVSPKYQRQGIGHQMVKKAMQALEVCGINKVALVVFERNENGNTFWEQQGFTARKDLVYRNKAITEMVRIDT